MAWLAGAGVVADACWLASTSFGLGYALWTAVDGIRRGRLGVDVIALLALAGAAPRSARRYRDGVVETVPLEEIAAGDVLLVASGDVHVILLLHTVQEEEAYLSLGTYAPGAGPTARS